MEEKRSGHEWARLHGQRIVDAVGWRRPDGVWLQTPITLADYLERIAASTVEETTPEGGRHSLVECALDVVPAALLRVGAALFHGERRREVRPQHVGEENWRRIRPRMHVRHALAHVLKWLAGDRSEDHLTNAACRLLMAMEVERG